MTDSPLTDIFIIKKPFNKFNYKGDFDEYPNNK